MKPIEEGCLALVIGTPCKSMRRASERVPRGATVHVIRRANRGAICGHRTWKVEHDGEYWCGVECALLRIDGYEGDDDEQVESLPLVSHADTPHACSEN